jgi:sigma-B regulation protein RsbU (phosphoserine phosphatase)
MSPATVCPSVDRLYGQDGGDLPARASKRAREVLTGMNNALCGNTQNQFVTAAFVYLDAQARAFRYAAAGPSTDAAATQWRGDGDPGKWSDPRHSETASFTQRVHSFGPGDRLVLYTDGVLEAADSDGALFGTQNLHTAIRKTSMLPPLDAANEITDKVKAWSKTRENDLTLIICDFVGAGP